MDWLHALSEKQPMAHAVLLLSVVIASGLSLSRIRYRGVGLGVAGVLFAGLAVGRAGGDVEPAVLEFGRELGLILFVFTIGLQLGPGFFSSLRADGLKLNALAAAVVACGTLLAALLHVVGGVDVVTAAGLLCGATTNTPSLGAAQQALRGMGEAGGDRAAMATLAYAVAYPGGIVGTIASLLLLKAVFRADPARESEELREEIRRSHPAVTRMGMVVENANLDGIAVGGVPGRRETEVIISRIRRAGRSDVETAHEQTLLHRGDTILVVGTAEHLEQFRRVVGRQVDAELLASSGRVTFRRVVVTRADVVGKTLRQLALESVHGVTVTRATRGELEITAGSEMKLQFGDFLTIVGDAPSLERAAAALGNSPKVLGETDFVPMFVGIALGVLVGLLPLSIQGVPVPVKLGLAGGPLLAAIVLARAGRLGPLVFYMPGNTGTALREFGIALFLACVGLKAGEKFVALALTAEGLRWMGLGIVITMVPLLVVGAVARIALKTNFAVLCGLMAGSMTDPPALAFAGGLAKSDAPTVSYAAVYPLTMILRIVAAQLLMLWD